MFLNSAANYALARGHAGAGIVGEVVKVVVEGKNVSAFLDGADKPALSIELLSDRHKRKLGLWVAMVRTAGSEASGSLGTEMRICAKVKHDDQNVKTPASNLATFERAMT